MKFECLAGAGRTTCSLSQGPLILGQSTWALGWSALQRKGEKTRAARRTEEGVERLLGQGQLTWIQSSGRPEHSKQTWKPGAQAQLTPMSMVETERPTLLTLPPKLQGSEHSLQGLQQGSLRGKVSQTPCLGAQRATIHAF